MKDEESVNKPIKMKEGRVKETKTNELLPQWYGISPLDQH